MMWTVLQPITISSSGPVLTCCFMTFPRAKYHFSFKAVSIILSQPSFSFSFLFFFLLYPTPCCPYPTLLSEWEDTLILIKTHRPKSDQSDQSFRSAVKHIQYCNVWNIYGASIHETPTLERGGLILVPVLSVNRLMKVCALTLMETSWWPFKLAG